MPICGRTRDVRVTVSSTDTLTEGTVSSTHILTGGRQCAAVYGHSWMDQCQGKYMYLDIKREEFS